MTSISSAPFSPEEIADEGLKPEEYEEIVRRLGRHPNKAELGMFGVMWSEHCCYKNSRPLLKQFPTTGPRILVGPGENAGVVDLDNGLRLAFKIESHNHPSAIEPFQGAATGVGGILRDIFTMGARPIAVLNSLRFGSLEDAKTQRLFSGVVAGIAHYGNCVGVPTVGGEVYFDPAYSDNPLVNVMALGLMETPEIVKSGASGIGNPVLYVGSTTGRDGMGGASFASAELTEESMDDRPAVQVGDPFLEKSLIEACLEAFKTGSVVAAQDMGAAGITCSTSEMAAKGGVGIEFDLDKIPVRETGMVPYEYLLSESQERMLFVAHKGREQELIDIFHRWGLQAVVAGTVIAEPIVRILFHGEVAAEIPAQALAENTPLYHRELLAEPPEYAQKAWQWTPESLPPCTAVGIEIHGQFHSWSKILLALLDAPTVASKRWIYRQYDHQVQNNTVLLPGGADAAVVRLRPQEEEGGRERGKEGGSFPHSLTPSLSHSSNCQSAVAATVDCNPRYVYLDPYEGAKAVVAEAARNLSCVGAEPLAVTDNLNFGSPEKPVGYWQLAEACRGLAEGCRELATPVTGGNVSLYNETLDSQGKPQPIYPTPVVGMVGLIPDLTQICGQAWQAEGDVIYLLGLPVDVESKIELGGSEYLATVHSTVAGKPPRVDFELERQIQHVCREGIRRGWIRSAHDCAEGGLAVAVAECCIASQLGAEIKLPLSVNDRAGESSSFRWDEVLFGEGGARIVVSVALEQQETWETFLGGQVANHWQKLGKVGKSELGLRVLTTDNQTLVSVSINDVSDRYFNALERRLTIQNTSSS
ncbi:MULTISPECIES: phosphoribosylformylglycinamidine synthase subunit PurL [Nostocales]|uniref:Phosphoribosylformylglycinamidine synthase subunit PurL n=3 Tax=Nostocales TaxID=1161 RepID=A0A0C1NEF2_9CYAN|nr:phosphoribosylformylglycinamidine synthase subunit PurL [Tolypothrix bouteillei]KAF3887226.1 phosphoribosylformylglycinamidine synthase subunit PurL [Tolypothrix bouteillei VB521301]